MPPPIDDIDTVSCRPDFAIPVYSGYLKAKDKDGLAPGLADRPSRVDLVEQTERARLIAENRNQQGERGHGLLSAGEAGDLREDLLAAECEAGEVGPHCLLGFARSGPNLGDVAKSQSVH